MDIMIKKAKKYLEKEGWDCDASDPTYLEFRARLVGKNIVHQCLGMLDKDILFVASILPQVISSEKRDLVLQLVNRFNMTFFYGGMELDMETGLLRIRNGMYLAGSAVTPEIIGDCISVTLCMADGISPLVTKVVNGECQPEEAVGEFYKQDEDKGEVLVN
ncbi:MAG: hypothetical protein P4N59_12315 [Negativicutes bacterium]|nr:hypothetical protein [Negativicutes bacterium]